MLNRDFRLSPPKALYYFIFTVSGFSGLIYESIWSHYLKLFLGHAAYAQSLVLSIFMGGMAAGAWLAGRYSSRWRTPILAYAIVEAIIGIFALIFHNSFVAITDTAYSSILPATDSVALAHALKWSIAALMIIPQSILLGMTFPLMTAGIIRRYPENSGASLSLLYFTNSIGAAVGVLASGFWLIKLVGLPGTIMTAGLINILLALAVWVIVRLDTSPATAPLKGTAKAVDASNKLLLAAAFVTGMASFIYEIGWIRMLSLVLGSSTHAFELMLSAFITGLALGGLWIRKRIDTIASPVMFAAYVQIIMGLLALLTLPLYGYTYDWMNMLMRGLARTEESYNLLLLASHGIVLIIMLPATFCAGMTLPLFTHALMKTGYGEKSIGQVYASNTFGSIVGVLFAVNMLPALGLQHLISAGATLDIALGMVLLFIVGKTTRNLLPAVAWSLTAVILGLALIGMSNITPEKMASGVFRYMRTSLPAGDSIYYYRDGKTASISLYGTEGGTLTIATNGKPDAAIHYDASENSADESTMTLLAILPFGYKPDASIIANIGMGSGMTTHLALTLPQVTRVDTIEIEPAMVEASRLFEDKVIRAHTDPRSKIHIEDAKTFFSLNNTQYDIIISEPSNPWVSGVSGLFTEEFYGHARRFLKDDGILIQWIHLYENNLELLFSVLKAIEVNFSDYALYFSNNGDLLIVVRNKGELGLLNSDFLLSNPELKQTLAEVQIKNKSDLHHRLIATKQHLSSVLFESGVPVNSDYFPFLDLNAHKAFFMGLFIKEFYTEAHYFPVVEMLMESKGIAVKKELTDMMLLTASTVHQMANEMALWMLSNVVEPPNFNHLTYEQRNELLSIKRAAAQCNRTPYDAQFQNNLHNMAKTMIAGLDKETASAALQSPTMTACSRIASPELASWIEFYQAIAVRDFDRIRLTAERQLKTNDFKQHKSMLAYVLAAALVAHSHAGTLEAGQSLWISHMGTFSSLDEVPFYLRLAVNSIYDYSQHSMPADPPATAQISNH